MNTNLGLVADPEALKKIEIKSNAFVQREIFLLNNSEKYCLADKPNTEGGLYLDFSKLKKHNKKKSIIYSSLRNLVKCEDIQSEAILLFIKASKSYFFLTLPNGSQEILKNSKNEYGRDIKFFTFAKNYISEKIKDYFSKENNLNGSDKTEKIHTYIRQIREKNIQLGHRNALNSVHLSYPEARDLSNFYNTKISKIFELESIQFGKVPNWKIISEDDDEVEVATWDNVDKAFSKETYKEKDEYSNLEIDENLINKENKILLKKSINNFIKTCNLNEKSIFYNRIYIHQNERIKLKTLSNKLNLSPQRIFAIEKNLLLKFTNYSRKNYFGDV